MVGGHERDRFAPIAHHVECKHRLVLDLETVELASGHVLMCEDRVNAGHRARFRNVDGEDPGVWVRAPHRRTPEHSIDVKVG